MIDIKIDNDWHDILKEELEKPYFHNLMQFVEQEYATTEVFPAIENIFRAFEICPFKRLKVVILGQDPYHGEQQANGLCFSVSPGVKLPPSLRNIFKEVAECGYTKQPSNGDLERWAKQGVLLLNSVLTVRAHAAASHADRGWEQFTDAVITQIAQRKQGIVYMLWGKYAQRKAAFVDEQSNLILRAVHPSPLSAYRGFLGCKHFYYANNYLNEKIKW